MIAPNATCRRDRIHAHIFIYVGYIPVLLRWFERGPRPAHECAAIRSLRGVTVRSSVGLVAGGAFPTSGGGSSPCAPGAGLGETIRAMATFRLLRQTSRSSRFAQVTVEVAASSRPEVEVRAAGTQEHRHEAELGARWALRGLPQTAKVVVTEVAVTDVDTGVGDVYEATAHAVWQALRVNRPVPYVGFSDPAMVTSWLTIVRGRRLTAVTEARHWYNGRREPDAMSLLHAWLYFENADAVQLHSHGDQLLLAKADPYPSYDMDEYGQTRVGPAQRRDQLSTFVGSRLTDAAVILGHDGPTACAGLLLRFDTADLIIGSLGDEWVFTASPEPAVPGWAVQPFLGSSR